MTLNFPNISRVYDETRRCIRFWGHDSAMEISFQIDEDALLRINPAQQGETAMLRVFDMNRVRIQNAAQNAYSRRRQNYHRLSAADF